MSSAEGDPGWTLFGWGCQQAVARSIPVWERIFDNYTFSRIVELGTGNGVFSFYLYVAAKTRGSSFVTYDKNPRYTLIDREFPAFREHRVEIDIYQGKTEIWDRLRRPGRTLLHIDADKAIAFRVFVPRLKIGDIAVVHDWGSEITDSDVEGIPVIDVLNKVTDVEGSLSPGGGGALKCFQVVEAR